MQVHAVCLSFILVFLVSDARALPYGEHQDSWSLESFADTDEWLSDSEDGNEQDAGNRSEIPESYTNAEQLMSVLEGENVQEEVYTPEHYADTMMNEPESDKVPNGGYMNSWSQESNANMDELLSDSEGEKEQEFAKTLKDQKANVESDERVPDGWAALEDNMEDRDENVEEEKDEHGWAAFEDDIKPLVEEETQKVFVLQGHGQTKSSEQPETPTSQLRPTPEDIMIQFFNSLRDPDESHMEEVDWNNGDSLQEEYDQGLIEGKWNTFEDFQNAQEESQNWRVYQQQNDEFLNLDLILQSMATANGEEFTTEGNSEMEYGVSQHEYPIIQDSDSSPDAFSQEKVPRFRGSDNTAEDLVFQQDSMPFEEGHEVWNNGYDRPDVETENMWNDVNGIMESLDKRDNEGERHRLTREIGSAYTRMKALNGRRAELEKRQDSEGNITKCTIKKCSPCEVKQTCVKRNGKEECVSEDPVAKQCCQDDYDPSCKVEKEMARDKIGEDIEEVTAELERIKTELKRLSEDLDVLDKSALNPKDMA